MRFVRTWPGFGLNNIGDIADGEGYQIKMSQLSDLVISGSVVSYDEVINLDSGWSIIGYLHQDCFNVVDMMDPVKLSYIYYKIFKE